MGSRNTSSMMKLGALLLVCCAGAVQGRRRAARDGAENEVMDKGDVVVKFPAFSYEVPEETLRKNVLRRKLRGRTITTSVEPMEESCYSDTFKMEMKELKKKVKCMPRDTVVDLVTPTGITIIPNTVVVKRCGGACGNGRLRCIAAETRNTTFYVKTKMGLSISCSSIAVPEDTRCSCGCERTECPGAQYYDEDLCRCVCPRKRARCEGDFKWDNQKCSCVCSRLCTTGTTLDPNKCRCVAKKK